MGDIEYGYCDVCGKEGPLQRATYYYDIKCECHSPKHFEIVLHCKNCIPKEPRETRITFNTNKLNEQIDFYKKEIENLVWNLAGCNTYADGFGLDIEHNKEMARPALDAVRKMAIENQKLKADCEIMKKALWDINQSQHWSSVIAREALKKIL